MLVSESVKQFAFWVSVTHAYLGAGLCGPPVPPCSKKRLPACILLSSLLDDKLYESALSGLTNQQRVFV